MLRIQDFAQKKSKGEKISMVTCYDYSFARILADSEVDCILVGDSLAMTMHGHSSTLPATISTMALHTAAVVRGASNKFIVADIPFLANRKGLTANVTGIGKLMQAGAHAVKMEGANGNTELIAHLVASGIPVMGHLGLTPQSVNTLGGFRVQGKTAKEHEQITRDALAMEQAGCFALVLECVPAALAKEISQALTIPTIGIGAGIGTDGQVLVLQDMLGMGKDFHPKFLRTYMKGFEQIKEAFNHYHRDVMTGEFPSEKESY
jgi:3-methyl-2-oxobutanoate hydroxymethyltransferase